MSEVSDQSQPPRRRVRTVWVWATLFVMIEIGMSIVRLTTNVPQRPPYVLMMLVAGLVGASVLVLLWKFIRSLRHWRNVRRTLVGLAAFATLVAVFYTVEDFRGKRAWTKCRRELEAEGLVLDWNAYIPPPVSDEQNIFKAPRMQEWFVGRGSSELSKRLGQADLPAAIPVAELTVVPLDTVVPEEKADLVMQYRDSMLLRSLPQSATLEDPGRPKPAIPLIVFDDVPLTIAISNFASRAEVHYTVDPSLVSGWRDRKEPRVTLRWTNVTPRRALLALLDNYDLQLVERPNGVTVRGKSDQGNAPNIATDPATTARLHQLIQGAIEQLTNGTRQARIKATHWFTFFAGQWSPVKPARLVVQAETTPDTNEIAAFFSWSIRPPSSWPEFSRLHVEQTGNNSFRVLVRAPEFCLATDYLAATDQFETDFDVIREALKRPYARMDGDYSTPAGMPIPNFVTIRNVAQTLTDRAKCHLLLGRPEEAFQELTLIHDLCRMLEAKPAGNPMLLVAAMIKVAVNSLYTETIAEGIRLQVWREPQIAALQQQLTGENLPEMIEAAFRGERSLTAFAMEHMSRSELVKLIEQDKTLADRLKDPQYLFIRLAPRGWFYQNMVVHSELMRPLLDVYDPTNGVFVPKQAKVARQMFDSIRISPYRFLNTTFLPNFILAWQTVAHHQNTANEAFIACALERYRLAHGNYPETLNALVPQFAEKIPNDVIGGQPLKYRRGNDGTFLLYSVGWNETDDGGSVALDERSKPNYQQGDWVWPNRKE